MGNYGYGDNYGRGDYYRGDRGDLFGFLKKAVGTVAHLIPGVGSVLDIGESLVSAATGLVGAGGHPNLPQPKLRAGRVALQAPGQAGLINVGPPGMGQSGLINVETDGGGTPMLPAGRAAKGFHANKSTYETRGGGTSRWGGPGLQLHPKGSVLVRNRRMNVANGRALRHALRRVGGFGRVVRRAKRLIARANSAVGNVHHRRAGKKR